VVQRRLKKFVLLVTPMGLAACATVWGFEDATERTPDGGTDALPEPVGQIVASDVQGIVCAPRAPEGWQGPLAIAVVKGTPLPALPECLERSQKVIDGNGEPNAPPGECKCACDPSKLGACASPVATFYTDITCTTACAPPQVVPTRQAQEPKCVAYATGTCPAGGEFAKITAAKPAGACDAKSSGDPPAYAWGNAVRLCGPKSDVVAKCDADKSLVPASALPFEAGNYCIASTTQRECPTTYPRKREFHDPAQVSDMRGCAPCTCGEPTGNCGGLVRSVDSPDSCSGGEKPHSLPTVGCTDFKGNNTGWGYEPDTTDASVDPKCPPVGGGPTGSFQAAPITVCCRS
jgi:hypothetical protein